MAAEPPAPRPASWQRLSPVQRTIAPIGLTAAAEPFVAGLSAWQDPRFTAPLEHTVDPAGPSGEVGGLVTVADPTVWSDRSELVVRTPPPAGPVQRRATFSPSVQRATGHTEAPPVVTPTALAEPPPVRWPTVPVSHAVPSLTRADDQVVQRLRLEPIDWTPGPEHPANTSDSAPAMSIDDASTASAPLLSGTELGSAADPDESSALEFADGAADPDLLVASRPTLGSDEPLSLADPAPQPAPVVEHPHPALPLVEPGGPGGTAAPTGPSTEAAQPVQRSPGAPPYAVPVLGDRPPPTPAGSTPVQRTEPSNPPPSTPTTQRAASLPVHRQVVHEVPPTTSVPSLTPPRPATSAPLAIESVVQPLSPPVVARSQQPSAPLIHAEPLTPFRRLTPVQRDSAVQPIGAKDFVIRSEPAGTSVDRPGHRSASTARPDEAIGLHWEPAATWESPQRDAVSMSTVQRSPVATSTGWPAQSAPTTGSMASGSPPVSSSELIGPWPEQIAGLSPLVQRVLSHQPPGRPTLQRHDAPTDPADVGLRAVSYASVAGPPGSGWPSASPARFAAGVSSVPDVPLWSEASSPALQGSPPQVSRTMAPSLATSARRAWMRADSGRPEPDAVPADAPPANTSQVVIDFTSGVAGGGGTAMPTVQRQGGAETPDTAATDPPPSSSVDVGAALTTQPPAGGPNPDDLVRQLFEPLVARLRAELRLDRERAGVLVDRLR